VTTRPGCLDSHDVSLPEGVPARFVDIDWRWALPRIALVFLVSRMLVLGVAVAAEATQPAPAGVVRVDERPILASLTLWDTEHYIGIAEDGYDSTVGTFPETAFYPGFPVTFRVASVVTGGDLALAAVLVANVAFALALVVLYALSVRHQAPERAVWSLWFLALAPPAFAFALGYSDSLFLLFAVAAFLMAETRHPWLAGAALALATLTRAPGILLVLPLLVLYVQRDGWHATRSWLPLLLVPAALAGFLGYLWWLTGDPLAPFHAQQAWDPASSGGTSPQDRVADVAPQAILVYWVGAIAATVFLFVFFRHDRMPAAYWLVAILAVLSVFLTGRLQSAPRYLAVAWPFDWVLANRRSVLGRRVLLGAFAAGQVVVAWLAFTWQAPP
jgi:hypothetical protein